MNKVPTILTTFPRTESSQVRLMLKMYRGKYLVDLRLYWLNKAGEWQATRKGAAIKPDELPELIRVLLELEQGRSDHD